jgi:hypothetical protein
MKAIIWVMNVNEQVNEQVCGQVNEQVQDNLTK